MDYEAMAAKQADYSRYGSSISGGSSAGNMIAPATLGASLREVRDRLQKLEALSHEIGSRVSPPQPETGEQGLTGSADYDDLTTLVGNIKSSLSRVEGRLQRTLNAL